MKDWLKMRMEMINGSKGETTVRNERRYVLQINKVNGITNQMV